MPTQQSISPNGFREGDRVVYCGRYTNGEPVAGTFIQYDNPSGMSLVVDLDHNDNKFGIHRLWVMSSNVEPETTSS